jgi:diacylglycerol kinase family enzyme/membrane-associated phospholipid phosphatase
VSQLAHQPEGRRQDPGWRATALWLLAAAVLLWLVLALIGRLLGDQWSRSALVRWDVSVERELAANRSRPWDVVTLLITFLAETITVITIGLLAFVALRLRLRRWREPLFLAVTVIGEVTIFVSTTMLVDRSRPPVGQLDAAPLTSSFPSGHTAASIALYGGLAVLAWRLGAATWLRIAAVALAVLAPVLVAMSRLYRGMHHPSDVAGGLLLACCWLAVTSMVMLGRRATAAPQAPVSSVAVVLNPAKIDDLEGLKAAITAHCGPEPSWYETTPADTGTGQTAAALAAGARLVLVCGGDGTIAACAAVLTGTGVTMAIVPVGTGNLLARNLGIPLGVTEALEIAFGPDERAIDVLEAADQRFTVMAGLGFDAALIRDTDETLKLRIGWLAYLGGMARALRRSPHARFTIAVDDGLPRTTEAIGVLVGNVGQLEAGITLMPEASPYDGQLDVLVLKPRTIGDWPTLAWRILRRRPDSGRQADILRGKRVSIESSVPVPVEYDGEFRGEATELRVEVLPAALILRCAPQ